MKSGISRLLVTFICVFCIALCGAFAKEQQRNQNFNTVIQELLVDTPDVKVPERFQSVAFKTVVYSETAKSPTGSTAFNGTNTLRDMFGIEKQNKKFDTTFVYLSKDKPIVAKASTTWYLMHEYPNGRLRFRLYYQKNLAANAMGEGDLLFLGKVDNERLFVVIVNSNSPVKDKLLASLQSQKSTVDTTKKKNVDEGFIVPPLIQPATSWYRVFFTPGFDCENNIISNINNSRKTIDIAVYSITNRNIVDAILAAHKRGVKVRVMTDKQQAQGKYSLVQEIIDAGIPVRMNVVHKIEHNKFGIFDGKEIESGSYNWTYNASKNNSENCMFFCQSGKEFSDRYEYLWKLYEPNKTVSP